MPKMDGVPSLNGNGKQPGPPFKLAITVFELEKIPLVFRVKAFLIDTPQCRLDFKMSSMVRLNRENFPGVPFKTNDDDSLLKAAVACDLVRWQLRKTGETIPGIYVLRNTSWSRVRDVDDLAISGPNGPRLNPAVFGEVLVEREPVVGPEIKAIEW